MKISNSKKQLAQIIHENGGWRDGVRAVYGAKTKRVCFLSESAGYPEYNPTRKAWVVLSAGVEAEFSSEPFANWHQTILSRDEYFHLYPAPDAEAEQKAEIRWVRGKDIYATPTAHDCMEMLKEKWGSTECGCDECSAFYSKPAAHAESTIEQLAADYRNAKDYADRKQQEADAAKADAEAKLAELVAAGKALGLVLSVAGVEPELVITDWRDLQVGDEVALTSPNGGGVNVGEVGVIRRIDDRAMSASFPSQEGHLISRTVGNWKFIRRPTKGDTNA